MGQPIQLSVVIPTLNEAATITACLDQFAAWHPSPELIVVDGGSTDATLRLLAQHPSQPFVMQSPRGRSKQLRAGAEEASGNVLLFLHADTILPRDADRELYRTLANPHNGGGFFQLGIEGIHGLEERAVALHSWWRGLTRTPLGDQAVFCWRHLHDLAGGIPDVPLLEDYLFACHLRLATHLRPVPLRVRTSGRRFHGRFWQQMWQDTSLFIRYHLGTPLETLRKEYRDDRPGVEPSHHESLFDLSAVALQSTPLNLEPVRLPEMEHHAPSREYLPAIELELPAAPPAPREMLRPGIEILPDPVRPVVESRPAVATPAPFVDAPVAPAVARKIEQSTPPSIAASALPPPHPLPPLLSDGPVPSTRPSGLMAALSLGIGKLLFPADGAGRDPLDELPAAVPHPQQPAVKTQPTEPEAPLPFASRAPATTVPAEFGTPINLEIDDLNPQAPSMPRGADLVDLAAMRIAAMPGPRRPVEDAELQQHMTPAEMAQIRSELTDIHHLSPEEAAAAAAYLADVIPRGAWPSLQVESPKLPPSNAKPPARVIEVSIPPPGTETPPPQRKVQDSE